MLDLPWDTYEVPHRLRLLIRAASLRDAVYSSNAALEFLWPVVLFICASIIVVYQFYSSYSA